MINTSIAPRVYVAGEFKLPGARATRELVVYSCGFSGPSRYASYSSVMFDCDVVRDSYFILVLSVPTYTVSRAQCSKSFDEHE